MFYETLVFGGLSAAGAAGRKCVICVKKLADIASTATNGARMQLGKWTKEPELLALGKRNFATCIDRFGGNRPGSACCLQNTYWLVGRCASRAGTIRIEGWLLDPGGARR